MISPSTDQHIVFAAFPRRMRMGLAGCAAVVATLGSLFWTPHSGLVQCSVVFMVVVLALRMELQLDLRTRRFRRLDGAWPLMSRREGSFEEFRCLRVSMRETVTHSDFAGVQTIARTYTAEIAWRRDSPASPWTVASGSNFEDLSARVASLADHLDLPVIETYELRDLRPELGPAAYDPRLTLSLQDAPVSLAAKLRR